MSRYAIYFAPRAGTPFARFGASWLGWDAATGVEVGQPDCGHLDSEAATRSPRTYGFHATIKAPFALAEGAREDDLRAALRTFCAQRDPISAPNPVLAPLGAFLALQLSAPCEAVDLLAADAVRAFDGFRRPLSEADRQRRLSQGLSDHERAHVERWGYPYVMDAYRFHMTLTGPLPPDLRRSFAEFLTPLVQPFCLTPLRLDGLALAYQPDRSARFRWLDWFAFGRAIANDDLR